MQKNQNQPSETFVKVPSKRGRGRKVHVRTHTHILFNSLHAEKFNEAFQWSGYFYVGTPGELGNIDVTYLFMIS